MIEWDEEVKKQKGRKKNIVEEKDCDTTRRQFLKKYSISKISKNLYNENMLVECIWVQYNGIV